MLLKVQLNLVTYIERDFFFYKVIDVLRKKREMCFYWDWKWENYSFSF